MTYEAVAAGVQATIAAHAQAQDDGRTEDMVALYTSDAVLIVPGMGTFEGTETLRATWESWKPSAPQRHVSANVVITEWSADAAKARTDVVFFQKGDAGWAPSMVARYHDEFRLTDGTWLISRREDEFL